MKQRLCFLCGKPVPKVKRPWHWWLWHVEGLPRHANDGPDAPQCYLDFQRRLGIKNPQPLKDQ